MTIPELGIHQGGDEFENFQSLPSSDEGEIVSDEEERSMEPQAEEDARNPSSMRNREIESSRPGRELDGGVSPDFLLFSIVKVSFYVLREALAARCAWDGTRLVVVLIVLLGSPFASGELYVNKPVDSEDLHQNISEMSIMETPLRSVRSVAQDSDWVFKLARHDFLLLRTTDHAWYKSEKRGPSSGQAGIHFNPVSAGPKAATVRFQSSISVELSLAQALAILTDHELDYNVWRENCWKYAHSRAVAILNFCMEIASNDDMRRNELKKELENLMDTRRHMPEEVVDIVQDWNILWRFLNCLTGVFVLFWLGFGRNVGRRRSFIYELGSIYTMLVVLLFMRDRNPILLTYNFTWLAATYRWHFFFLTFVGYYIGWTVFLRGVESWMVELERHSEYLFLRTEVSGSDITTFGPNYHQDYSMEDQRRKRCSRTLVFGFVLVLSVMTFEQTSISTVCLHSFLVCWGLWAIKRFTWLTDEN